jgi:hypothetical protein
VVVVAAPHLIPLEAVYNRAAYCAVRYLAIFNDCDDLTRAYLGYCISNAKNTANAAITFFISFSLF